MKNKHSEYIRSIEQAIWGVFTTALNKQKTRIQELGQELDAERWQT